MKITLLKRVRTEPGGDIESSLVAAFARDEKIINSLPLSTPIEFESSGSTKDKNIGKYIALRKYFYNNLPEKYTNIDDFTGEESPVFGSEKVLDQWLSLEVGWCHVAIVEGETRKFPRRYDTKSEPDRLEVDKYFFQPGIKKMAVMMGMEVYDMIQASINSSNRRTE